MSTNKPTVQKTTVSKNGKSNLTKSNLAALKTAVGEIVMPRLFYQLVVFILDGSGSMTLKGETGKSKGKEVEDSVKKVINRLQGSRNKNSFDISMYAYANESQLILSQKSVTEIDLTDSIDPCEFINDHRYTYIAQTLEKVEEEVKDYLNKNQDKSSHALILILSDGALNDQDEAEDICNRLKANTKIAVSSILFRSPDWEVEYGSDYISELESNMEDIASGKEFFKSTVDADAIRKHMIKSISKVSKVD